MGTQPEQPDSSGNAHIGVYIDFDNIVMSRYDELHGHGTYRLDKAGKSSRAGVVEAKAGTARVDIAAIIDYASTFGTVSLARAYADWSTYGNAEYAGAMLASSVDLVQMFPLTGSKNGADIRLAIDVIDDLTRLPHLTHVLVVAGDSDYVSLAQRCRHLGRTVIGVGAAKSVGEFFRLACDEFCFYGLLPSVKVARQPSHSTHRHAPATARTSVSASQTVDLQAARDLVIRAMAQCLVADDAADVRASILKNQMKRLDSTFNERAFGFTSFSEFLGSMSTIVTVTHTGNTHVVTPAGLLAQDLTGPDSTDHPETDSTSAATAQAPADEPSPLVAEIRSVIGLRPSSACGPDWDREAVACVMAARVALAGTPSFTGIVELREAVLALLNGGHADRATPLQRRVVINVFILLDITTVGESGLILHPELAAADEARVGALLREALASKAHHKAFPNDINAKLVGELVYGTRPASRASLQVFERVIALPTVQQLTQTLREVFVPAPVLRDVVVAITQVDRVFPVPAADTFAFLARLPLDDLERDLDQVHVSPAYVSLCSAGVIAEDEAGELRNVYFGADPDVVHARVVENWIQRLQAADQAYPDEWTWHDSLYRMLLVDRVDPASRSWVRERVTSAIS